MIFSRDFYPFSIDSYPAQEEKIWILINTFEINLEQAFLFDRTT